MGKRQDLRVKVSSKAKQNKITENANTTLMNTGDIMTQKFGGMKSRDVESPTVTSTEIECSGLKLRNKVEQTCWDRPIILLLERQSWEDHKFKFCLDYKGN